MKNIEIYIFYKILPISVVSNKRCIDFQIQIVNDDASFDPLGNTYSYRSNDIVEYFFDNEDTYDDWIKFEETVSFENTFEAWIKIFLSKIMFDVFSNDKIWFYFVADLTNDVKSDVYKMIDNSSDLENYLTQSLRILIDNRTSIWTSANFDFTNYNCLFEIDVSQYINNQKQYALIPIIVDDTNNDNNGIFNTNSFSLRYKKVIKNAKDNTVLKNGILNMNRPFISIEGNDSLFEGILITCNLLDSTYEKSTTANNLIYALKEQLDVLANNFPHSKLSLFLDKDISDDVLNLISSMKFDESKLSIEFWNS